VGQTRGSFGQFSANYWTIVDRPEYSCLVEIRDVRARGGLLDNPLNDLLQVVDISSSILEAQ
jgi:hypothetical protein